jgi:hypothetical protein
MNFNDIIASLAIGLGFVQMYDSLQKSEEVGDESRDVIIMGIITTALWLTYHYKYIRCTRCANICYESGGKKQNDMV